MKLLVIIGAMIQQKVTENEELKWKIQNPNSKIQAFNAKIPEEKQDRIIVKTMRDNGRGKPKTQSPKSRLSMLKFLKRSKIEFLRK